MQTFPCVHCDEDCYEHDGVILMVGLIRDAEFCEEAPRRGPFPGFHQRPQGGQMTTQAATRSICLKCSEEIIYNNIGVTTSIDSPPVMAWTTLSRLQDDTCRAGGQHSPADTTAGGGTHAYTPGTIPPGVSCGGFPGNGLEDTDLATLMNLGATYAEERNNEGAQQVADELIARGLVDRQGNPTEAGVAAFTALGENKEGKLINPETTRRIEVIDMALSFGADPETSMPLTDERRRLLEKEKELLQSGSTPDEVKEASELAADEDEVIRMLMGTQPEPEPDQSVKGLNDEVVFNSGQVVTLEGLPEPPPGTDCAGPPLPEGVPDGSPDERLITGGPYGPTKDEPVQTLVQTPEPEVTPSNAPPITPPAATPQPAAEPTPSIAEQVKSAVTESLAQLLGTGGGNSSLDDLLSKIDPRDSESALKMFTWLWENHRFQVIGQLNGGGYMLHYAEPKGTSQAGYIPGGTKGGRMVDTALAAAKDNPAAAHRGMCPQCMSAVKKMDDTGQVLSDDGTDNPECPAGGNHAFVD